MTVKLRWSLAIFTLGSSQTITNSTMGQHFILFPLDSEASDFIFLYLTPAK